MDSITWGIACCLSSEDGRLRCDSPLQKAANHVEWTGSVADPVLRLDGFSLASEMLSLSFRLKSMQPGTLLDQISQCRVEFLSNALVYHGEGSPRKGDIGKRRDSVHGNEDVGIVDTLPVSTLSVGVAILHYIASRYQEHSQKMGTLVVTRLELKHTITLPRNGHKIALLLEETYLGRAQEIETVGGKRIYRWTAHGDDPIGQVPYLGPTTARGKHYIFAHTLAAEISDLKQISAMTPSTTMTVPDNDAYSNPIRKLPILVKKGESACISLFNLRPGPKLCHTSVTITWAEFLEISPSPQTPRRSVFKQRKHVVHKVRCIRGKVERTMSEGIVCTIWFTIQGVEQLELYTIVVAATSFDKTLQFG